MRGKKGPSADPEELKNQSTQQSPTFSVHPFLTPVPISLSFAYDAAVSMFKSIFRGGGPREIEPLRRWSLTSSPKPPLLLRFRSARQFIIFVACYGIFTVS